MSQSSCKNVERSEHVQFSWLGETIGQVDRTSRHMTVTRLVRDF